MRKSNSIFKTAFVSEAGSRLANDDYFAYVELDDYACYVLATGITDFVSTEAAKEAAENLLVSFQEKPSMAKATLLRYMKDANKRLLSSQAPQHLKASLLMIVTDYEQVRYAEAGNVRLRFYRHGRIYLESSDMSLAQDLVNKGDMTPLDKHEERNNLYAYMGKEDFFYPYISKKFKLMDSDILAFYTKGLWEHVDTQEIDEVFSEATDDPKNSIDCLEDMLLSRQVPEMESYTIAAIFINKAYRDPEREQKRQRYIRIAIIVVVIILLLSLIGWFLHWRYQKKVQELQDSEDNTITYMKSDNYLRAKESCAESMKLASDLGDKKEKERMRRYSVLIEAVIRGDDAFAQKNFVEATTVYMDAMELSRDADLLGYEYIQRRLGQAESYIHVNDFIDLGDKALQAGNLDRAEECYFKARDKAIAVHDMEGRRMAMDALGRLYDDKAKKEKMAEDQQKKANDAAIQAALQKGDALMQAGDVEGAEKAYLQAQAIANSTGDRSARNDAVAALSKTHDAQAEKEKKEQDKKKAYEAGITSASGMAAKGDESFNAGDYLSAEIFYRNAQNTYLSLGEADAAAKMKEKADDSVTKYNDLSEKKKAAEEKEAAARESYLQQNFSVAKQWAVQAKQMYTDLGLKEKSDELQLFIEQIDTDAAIAANL